VPLVPESRLKGNHGAALVMSRLSQECLVRPVSGDTDVGIDLYCETVSEQQPFVHFWLQVKSGEQCYRYRRQLRASCHFDHDHLRYWNRQPVPVFAALVPMSWPPTSEPDVFVVDITGQLLSKVPTGSRTLASDFVMPAGDQDSVRQFLSIVVPETAARQRISHGVLGDLPTLTPRYVRNVPRAPVLEFKSKILYQLRSTAANSVIFACRSGKLTKQDMDFLGSLAEVASAVGDGHWEAQTAVGLVAHLNGDYVSASNRYQNARNLLRTELAAALGSTYQATWAKHLGEVQRLLAASNSRQPPDLDG